MDTRTSGQCGTGSSGGSGGSESLSLRRLIKKMNQHYSSASLVQ
jgi:hypothetical protein